MRLWTPPLLVILIASHCFGSVGLITTTLPNGTVGTPYTAVIQATGGCTPYAWATLSGSLPSGITAKSSKATTSLNLTGTPKTAATYSFTEQVTGCGGQSSKKLYKIIIQATANHVVDLSWNASNSQNVAGYNIYRAPDGVNWKKINASLIPSLVYSDSTVANGSTYYYAATTVDIYGKESVKTPAVKAVIP
jgi:hypothetical protein